MSMILDWDLSRCITIEDMIQCNYDGDAAQKMRNEIADGKREDHPKLNRSIDELMGRLQLKMREDNAKETN